METNELRRGNLVNTNNEIMTVDTVGVNSVTYIKETNRHGLLIHPFSEIKEVKPIPLTEEWLIKCGFSVTDENYAGKIYHIVKVGQFLNDDLMLVLWLRGEREGMIFRKSMQIKHLHQLQNLYFALTGEELEINIS